MESDPLSLERIEAAVAWLSWPTVPESLPSSARSTILAALALAERVMVLQIVEICTLGETNHWHAGPEVTQGQLVRIVPVADGENEEAT